MLAYFLIHFVTGIGGGQFICHCLPPDRTWHKVNDSKVDYSVGLGEGKVEAWALLEYNAALPPEGGPVEGRRPYGLKSAFVELCPYHYLKRPTGL